MPRSFDKAKNDGERWRWALAQAVEADPGLLNTSRLELADFLLGQFGTQTLAGAGLARSDSEDGQPEDSGLYALDTLHDDETIARLATGIKRFKLPDEFNPIKIYQADRRRSQDRARRGRARRTGVDLREPPPARPGGRVSQAKQGGLRRPRRRRRPSSSTRSSAPGASSSRA